MKTWICSAICLGILLLSCAGQAQTQLERILHFDSQIQVHTNGSLTVTETIQVNAMGNQINHGIYRDFPQLYQGPFGLRTKTGFAVQDVRCDGRPEDFHLADRQNGQRVYIGSAATTVTPGLHTYELTYTTDRQLGLFKDHDELYWNVTGNGWIFPLEAVTANVTLPKGALATNLTAYTGPQGGHGRDFVATKIANTASFHTTRPLPPENGLTIVVEWPKGFVMVPAGSMGWLNLLRANLDFDYASGGLLLVAVYFFGMWLRVGRDPRRGVIIPLYEPPEEFSPAAVRYLYRMGYDNRVFAATILDLAVKGVIRIRQDKEMLWKKVFTLVPQRNYSAQLSAEDEIIRRELVGDGTPLTLRQEYYATLQSAREKLKSRLAESQDGVYFSTNSLWSLLGAGLSVLFMVLAVMNANEPEKAAVIFTGFFLAAAVIGYSACVKRFIAVILGLGGLVVGWILLHLGVAATWMMVLAATFGLLNGAFLFLLKAPTRAGRKILDQIEGFKTYLSVAEKDRLNLENPPERTPQHFEMFLPYALALDVEQQWSEQFAGVLAAAGATPGQSGYSPAWYSGDSWSQVGAASFAGALGGSLAGAISSASTAPGSSSGGGGGGGGSSGGGGGGGGGGGW